LAKADALRREHLHHQRVRSFEIRAREAVRAQAILVGDDDELETLVAQLQHRRNHARHEAQSFVGIDLETGGLFDQRAIAINKQNASHAVASLLFDSAAITASFSSGDPMLMRNASCSCSAA